MLRDEIANFKNDATDTLNELSGRLAIILKDSGKTKREKILDIETEEEKVRDRINRIDENTAENEWDVIKNEIKESLNKIKKDLEGT